MSGREQNWILLQVSSAQSSAFRMGPHRGWPPAYDQLFPDVPGRYVAVHIHGAGLQTETTLYPSHFSPIPLDLHENWAWGARFSSYGIHWYMRFPFGLLFIFPPFETVKLKNISTWMVSFGITYVICLGVIKNARNYARPPVDPQLRGCVVYKCVATL